MIFTLPRMGARRGALVAVAAAASVAMTACVANNPEGDPAAGGEGAPIKVTIADDSCEVATSRVPSGRVQFTLVNEGTVRNEFEILAEDRLRIVGERENLGPGTTTDYTVLLEPGNYVTACKKNMVGALVGDKDFIVTEGEAVELAADEQKLIDDAVTNYTAYVRDQVGQLLSETQAFAEVYKRGESGAAEARERYAPVRMHYERIEPTAEAFGDIDPALDEREADYQEDQGRGAGAGDAAAEGDGGEAREWTGWHRLEKDLWDEGYALSEGDRARLADQLVADTQELYDLVYSEDFQINISDISNGAISLLEEVATTKITGEEEAFSHTDLYDFQANLEGARVAYGNVAPLAEKNDPELADAISARIDALSAELDKHREGDGFVSYDTVDEAQRRALSDLVDALRVPLATLTEAIV